jgi:predicted dehydrogenase
MMKVKLGFIGCGDVAQRDYLPEIHRIEDRVELVAVCGRTEARVRDVAARYGFAARYIDYRRMLAEAGIDAVINLTPIQLHTETTLAALEAGKHVYSEKPVAGNVAEASRIRDEARQRNLKLVCAPCVMIFPQVKYAQSLLAQGAIGEIYSARGRGYGGVPPWSGYMSDPSPFFAKGGGPLRDMGVYPLHALTGLLGPVRRVTAMAHRTRDGFVVRDGPVQGKTVPVEVNDNWNLILDFGGNRQASLEANNCVQATRASELELFGLGGTVALSLIDVGAPVELMKAGGDGSWQHIHLPPTGRASGPDHLLGIEHLVDCIQHDRQPILNIEHALHVVEVMDKAEQSAISGQTMEVESAF